MPRIPSPNPDAPQVNTPGIDPGYTHPAHTRKGPIPMAFQVTSPFDRRKVLLPHALVLHVNPMSLQETHAQKIERIQTRGGWVEQHWGHDLSEISADQSTGAFMNIRTGLTSVLRRRTIAWNRFRDLHDLFKNNGSVRNPEGQIVLQGNIMLMYDKGVYLGSFRNFGFDETDSTPFSFVLNWSFKVEQTIVSVNASMAYRGANALAPQFQGMNTQPSKASANTPPSDVDRSSPDYIPNPGDQLEGQGNE